MIKKKSYKTITIASGTKKNKKDQSIWQWKFIINDDNFKCWTHFFPKNENGCLRN